MSKATLTIRFNSSYVLIGTTSDRLGTGAARPPAPRLSILYCQCVGCPDLGPSWGVNSIDSWAVTISPSESLRSGIPTLKYAVKYRIPFGRLVEPTSGICNICPLFWGTGIELCPFLDSTGWTIRSACYWWWGFALGRKIALGWKFSCAVVICNLIGGLKSELSDLGLCPSSLISSKRGDSFSKILENGCRVSRQLNNILLFSGVATSQRI